ncbi:MAG TPA: septal ring lytic transglycosylase RlpA family protein [Geobacteraceae bacterium]|nr:septal ring lytic transglycosylase RlpA family protein [Geobacteraceae bacterium]
MRIVLLLSCLVLTACGTTGRRVVVEPGLPGQRPWQRPYSVDGERYVPLQYAEGYREEGLASWYGAEEHGGPTSNGETFDMYRPSAAHKTLPLGCYIRVTNKLNGRQTIVRVNDRGPFIPERIVDLSFYSARELDIVDRGVAPVLIEVVSPGSNGSGRPADDPAVVWKGYMLQVASFSDPEKARLLSERLRKELAYATVREVETENGRFYRVQAGRFSSRSAAEFARLSLARNGFPDAFIITP